MLHKEHEMQRFFHECFSDPFLGAVIAVALILALTMAFFILREEWRKRRRYRKWERRVQETREKVGKRH